MTIKGLVTKVEENLIEIQVYRTESCVHCNQCGDEKKFSTKYEMKTTIQNIKIGDIVSLDLPGKVLVGLSFLLYMIPVFLFFISYFVAAIFTKNETYLIISSFVGLILTFLVIFVVDKKKGKKLSANLKIIAVNGEKI